MSEADNYRGTVAQVDEPHDPQTRDPEFDSRSGLSFDEIFRNRSQRRRRKFLQKLMLIRTKQCVGPENNSDSEKIAFIALLSELTRRTKCSKSQRKHLHKWS
jgi:hypothetical protein